MHHFVRSSNDLLRKRGYRLTPQRYMILSVIQEANEHLSTEQILERVQERNPYVSLSTVYRTLDLLLELRLIRENHLAGGQPHYEVADSQAHHHLVCRRCHAVIHLDDTLLGNLHEELQTQYHFHDLALELSATGYCDTCWQALQEELYNLAGIPETQPQQGKDQDVEQQAIKQIDLQEAIERSQSVK